MAVPRETGDFRLNLRPVVLGVCFLWGVLLGFLANFYREPDVDPPQRTVAPKPQVEPLTPTPSNALPAEVPDVTPVHPYYDAPAPAVGPLPFVRSRFPDLPPPRLDTSAGLTGRIAPMPVFPAAPPPVRTPAVPVAEPVPAIPTGAHEPPDLPPPGR